MTQSNIISKFDIAKDKFTVMLRWEMGALCLCCSIFYKKFMTFPLTADIKLSPKDSFIVG